MDICPGAGAHRHWVLIRRRPTCDVVAGCNWQCWAICFSGCPAHLRWIADVLKFLKFARNANRIGAIFNHSTYKYGSSRLTGVRYVHRWCSHKIFSLPTTTDNRRLACEVELSSTSQTSRRSMPGTDYDSAINVHISCPRYVGGIWEPGFIGRDLRFQIRLLLEPAFNRQIQHNPMGLPHGGKEGWGGWGGWPLWRGWTVFGGIIFGRVYLPASSSSVRLIILPFLPL